MAMSVLHWNEAQVNQFFVSLGLTRYEQAIKEHALTGDVLIHLDNELLKDIGIKSVGKRLTILKAIYKLKLKEDIPIEDGHWTPPLGDLEQDDSEPDTHSDSSPLLATPPTPNQHQHQHPDSLNHLFLIRDQRIKSLESDVSLIKQELHSLSARLLALSSTPNSPCILVDTVSRTSAATRAQDRHMREESICQLDIHDPSLASPALSHTTPIIPSHEDTKPPPTPDPSNQTQEVLQTQMFNNKELSPAETTTTTTTTTTIGDTLSIAAATPKPSDRAGSKTTDNKKTGSTTTTMTTTTGGKENSTTQERDASNPYKSFRVTLEDPCYKVLPAALKKYKINEHYKNYVLFICYGKQERCLSYEEKPLLLFQKLKEANQNPVFTLRHIKDIESPVSLALSKQAHRREKKLAAAEKLNHNPDHPDRQAPTTPNNNAVSIPRKIPPNSGRVEKASGFCIAIYPYISEGEDDLDVGSKGWWVVNRDKGSSTEMSEEQQGWIPSGCLLETKKSFSIGTTGKAKGIDELGFDIKDRLKVYKKYNNWSYAINESRPEKPRGWTPSWLIGTRKDKEGARSTSPVSAPTTSTTTTTTTTAAAAATTVTTSTTAAAAPTATTNLSSSHSGSSSGEGTTRTLKPSLSSSSSSLFDRHRQRGAPQQQHHPVSRSSSSTTGSIFSDSTSISTSTVTPATSVFASTLSDHFHPLRHPASSLKELKLSPGSSSDLANAIT
ncbi:hypothetical protein PCANC_26187 [Puccinia coronata f. sp. avenae]|uniref:SAM domain-containing protein n=1 Tax=Puccinia coronata f. sp. avenae TaxID=200324 RepID=A0A2N5TJT8_9BASI|nr:hypothetical protein PCANC_26187 [Puccinia coronata f. sp. avenae]